MTCLPVHEGTKIIFEAEGFLRESRFEVKMTVKKDVFKTYNVSIALQIWTCNAFYFASLSATSLSLD